MAKLITRPPVVHIVLFKEFTPRIIRKSFVTAKTQTCTIQDIAGAQLRNKIVS